MRVLCAVLFSLCVAGEIGLCAWWFWFDKDGLEPIQIVVGIAAGGFLWGVQHWRPDGDKPRPATKKQKAGDTVISELRQILKDRYDDARLSDLLQDHFNDVYRNQSGQPRDAKIRALLDWCQSHDQLTRLKELLDAQP